MASRILPTKAKSVLEVNTAQELLPKEFSF